MSRKVAFVVYPVVDVARARRFYEETPGLEAGLCGHQGRTHWIEYDLPGGGCLAITNAGRDKPGTGGGTVALEVEDLSALMEDLKRKSVELKGGTIEGPSCRMAVCLDSEGNSLLLHQSDRGSDPR